ncbi:cytochrome P450 [Infundibulicybe gibba]|nr:cytochrome P450 [Infundibulicybe gibba]
MLLLLLKTLALYSCAKLVWSLLRRFLVKTDLDNIPGPPSPSIWTGNFRQIFNFDGWDFHKSIAQTYGVVSRVSGPLGEKQLYIFDPKALHHIVVKDQYIYEESTQSNTVVFGKGLLATLGDHHRKQRKMLNPVFSIAHMRRMVPIFHDIAHKLQTAISLKVAQGPQEIDMVHWMTRAALELIGQGGLGYSFDSLQEDVPSHPYSHSAKEFMSVTLRLFFYRSYVLPHVAHIGPPWFRRLWSLHQMRDIVDTMHNTSKQIFEGKKAALREGDEALSRQIGQGNDIMSILMRANMEAADEDRLPETLTFAAMDTTSNALSRILHLLATHQDVQERLRQEIQGARTGAKDLSYDDLVSLPYLDAVCRETLRLYPPVSTVQRTTRHDVVLPLSTPIRGLDGREMTEISIPNNTTVNISILNSNCNPAIWGPDSYEWKPDRWLGELPETVAEAHIPGIYSHLMTFLGGGRACIGFKFSQLEMKAILSLLIEKFRFGPAQGTEIAWRMTIIASPNVKGSTDRSQLPLRVSLVA